MWDKDRSDVDESGDFINPIRESGRLYLQTKCRNKGGIMWFSNYYGQNWTIDKGVNDRFAMEVRLIRDKFSTKKTSQTGRETSTTRVHIDTRSGPVEVILTNFVWDGFHRKRLQLTVI